MGGTTSAIECFCRTCGKSVGLKFPCHRKKSKNFFCTNDCKSAYQRTTKGLRANKATCGACNKEYLVKPSHAPGRYACSRKCKGVMMTWRTGEQAIRWKGGWVTNNGYIVESHTLQHRRVMEQHLHRNLTFNEVVHHIDGNKKNNVLENLVLMSRSDHSKMHQKRRWAK